MIHTPRLIFWLNGVHGGCWSEQCIVVERQPASCARGHVPSRLPRHTAGSAVCLLYGSALVADHLGYVKRRFRHRCARYTSI